MQSLYAPVVSHDTGLISAANSGDYSKLIEAAGPQLGILSSQQQQAEQQILNSTPSGAGRDAAVAQLPQQQATAVAGTLNNSYREALAQLQQLGASYGGIGISEAGAGMAGLQGGGSTLGSVAQEQNQGKSSTMSLLGSLAGGAGAAAGGGVFGHL